MKTESNVTPDRQKWSKLHPPHKLGKIVQQLPPGAPSVDPIMAGEKALEDISFQFEGWLEEEIAALNTQWTQAAKDPASSEKRYHLYQCANDLRGTAATFGYPLVAELANSLCMLLENIQALDGYAGTLAEQHVLAIRAVLKEKIKDKKDETAATVSVILTYITQNFIRQSG